MRTIRPAKTFLIKGEAHPPLLKNISMLRIVLALVLALTHGLTALKGIPSTHTNLIPVVPVFLFIAGYYIFASYKKRPLPIDFIWTRYFKLLPIILVSVCATLGLLAIGGGARVFSATLLNDIPAWLLGQFSVLQGYYPPGFAETGIAAKNSPMWFISALLIYYISIPVIAAVERWFPHFVWLIIGLSLIYYTMQSGIVSTSAGVRATITTGIDWAGAHQANPVLKAALSAGSNALFFAWMFYAGCLARRYQSYLLDVSNLTKIIVLSGIVSLLIHVSGVFTGIDSGLAPWYFPFYVGLWIAATHFLGAYTHLPNLSIGIFVWHAQVNNLMVTMGLSSLMLSLVLTVLLAGVTYYLVERPFSYFRNNAGARLLPAMRHRRNPPSVTGNS